MHNEKKQVSYPPIFFLKTSNNKNKTDIKI